VVPLLRSLFLLFVHPCRSKLRLDLTSLDADGDAHAVTDEASSGLFVATGDVVTRFVLQMQLFELRVHLCVWALGGPICF
jgi:hypothetical protein